MALGELLAASNTAVVAHLTGVATVTGPTAGPFDKRPAWDNWSNKGK
ncbi:MULTISPECIES: hypothetical protein [unclassified Kitasatospora]